MNTQATPRTAVLVEYLGLAVLVAALAYWRFAAYQSDGPWGDDIFNLAQHRGGSLWSVLWDAITKEEIGKYRPLFSLAWTAWTRLFGLDFWKYHFSLIALHCCNALVFYAIARRLSEGRRVLSAALTLVFAGSHFALFQVSMLTGIVEALAFTFFLLMLLAVALLRFRPTMGLGIAAVTALTAAAFTHERYLAAVPWLSAVLWFSFRPAIAGNRTRLLLAAAPIALLLVNVALKLLVLQVDFLVGTGGEAKMSPPVGRALMLVGQAMSSLLGFNRGPEYLTGRQIFIEGPIDGAWLLGAIYFVGLTLALGFSLLNARGSYQARMILGFFVLSALMLIPPALTIRMEQRWLLAPFALLLLSCALALAVYRKVVVFAVILACLGSFALDALLCRSLVNTYIGGGATMGNFGAATLKNDRRGEPGTPMIVMAHEDACYELKNPDRDFYVFFEGVSRELYCTPKLERLEQLASEHPHAVVFKPGVDGRLR